MRFRQLKNPIWSLAVVTVLAVMQTVLLAHSDLGDTHPAGDNCVLCAGLSSLGAANVAASPVLELSSQPVVAAESSANSLPDHHPAQSRARGPPTAS